MIKLCICHHAYLKLHRSVFRTLKVLGVNFTSALALQAGERPEQSNDRASLCAIKHFLEGKLVLKSSNFIWTISNPTTNETRFVLTLLCRPLSDEENHHPLNVNVNQVNVNVNVSSWLTLYVNLRQLIILLILIMFHKRLCKNKAKGQQTHLQTQLRN